MFYFFSYGCGNGLRDGMVEAGGWVEKMAWGGVIEYDAVFHRNCI